MTKMILFIRAHFFLIYFLVFIQSEARTLLEKQHGQKVVESGYGREPVPVPPTPESSSPSNQERLKRHAHLPPPAPKHGPKIDQVTTSSHGRESSELLMTITSNVISDNELLIMLPSTSDNQERFGKHSHVPPPAPKPADEQHQIIVTSSNCQHHMNNNNYGREEKIVSPPSPKPADGQGEIIITSSTTTTTTTNDDDQMDSNYIGREERKLTPPSPHHDAPIGQLTTRYGGQELKPYKSLISSLPLQASY